MSCACGWIRDLASENSVCDLSRTPISIILDIKAFHLGALRHPRFELPRMCHDLFDSVTPLYAKAIEQIEHYYFVRPHDLRRIVVFFAMGIAWVLALQGRYHDNQECNDDIFVKLAYGLSIATVTAAEIVIGYWRQARDNALRAIEASLSEARRQIERPSARGGGLVRKRRQNPRGGRPVI